MEVLARITMDQFLMALLGRMRAAKTLRDLVVTLECTLNTHEMGRRERMDPERVNWQE